MRLSVEAVSYTHLDVYKRQAEYLADHDVQMSDYAERMEQISVYNADMLYKDLFEGQTLNLWPIDEAAPDTEVVVISISDFNRALSMQDKAPISPVSYTHLFTHLWRTVHIKQLHLIPSCFVRREIRVHKRVQ